MIPEPIREIQAEKAAQQKSRQSDSGDWASQNGRVDPGTANSYAMKALADECAIVAATPQGQRNEQLNISALKMGRHVGARSIELDTARDALLTAGMESGLPRSECETVLRLTATGPLIVGQTDPRHPSGPTASPAAIVGPQEKNSVEPEQPPPPATTATEETAESKNSRVKLTPASAIRIRRVRWLWRDRIAYGTLALLAGREGLGKSTLAYELAARISRGQLEGEDFGNPRNVLVCASEDSWEHTIAPRLIAAQTNLDRVFRIEIATGEEARGLTLPRDNLETAQAATETEAALLILDPLMSVVDARLDAHRDREVRQALDPLARLADHCHMSVLGLIHHNKSGSTDALQLVMGSKAFAAVARSVHTCIPDPDDEDQDRRLFATTKNNLGSLNLPVLGFTISSAAVETDDDGTAWTGRIEWTDIVTGSMHEIMTRAADPDRSATAEATDWLYDYVCSSGGQALKTDIMRAGKAAGHSEKTLRNARVRLKLEYRNTPTVPRQTMWVLGGSMPKPESL